MLKLQNIDMTFGGTRPVFRDFNLTVNTGEFVILLGSNGAGKSTLFNIISGLIKPDKGTILLDDINITNTNASARSKWIAKVTQDPKAGTCENMTIFENMAFAFKRGQTRWCMPIITNTRKAFFQEKLAMLNMGLENRLNESVKNLSGGQRQALSVIMMFLTDAKLVLLDEITAALDPAAAKQVMQITDNIILHEQRTCIMITHNKDQAREYGDRIIKL